jgi:hypothetical protein
MSAPLSKVIKRALLIERAGGPLITLTPCLERSQCEVMRTADVKTVAALVRDLRRLSMALVNGSSLRSDPLSLVRTIKDQHPDLPILWFTEDGATLKGRPAQKVELVGSDLVKLEATLAARMRDGFYSQPFVEHLKSLAKAVLSDAHLPGDPAEICIKSSLTALSELNVFISFNGRGFAGHLVLSSTMGDLRLGYARQFPDGHAAGHDDLEDFLGETANRLMGRLKQSIEGDDGDSRIGAPTFVRGAGAGFRHKAGGPTLAIDFGNGAERLQLELCLYRFDDWALGAGRSQEVGPGELKFL